MPRTFNTTGPCDEARHYMVPAEAWLPDLLPWVEEQRYFVLHAARQTGKTTAMMAFAARLRERGYVAVWATLETCDGVVDVVNAEPLWLGSITCAAEHQLPAPHRPPKVDAALGGRVGDRLGAWLRDWAATVLAPVVLLLDEADLVSGPALHSLLEQLRAGYGARGLGRFPASVALVGRSDRRGLHDAVRAAQAEPDAPFAHEAPALRNFTREAVKTLYAQHTADTGQAFTKDAVDRAFWLTDGHPHLVNAVARHGVGDVVSQRGAPITGDHVEQAKEQLILERNVHIDGLSRRLRDPRMARVVLAALVGDSDVPSNADDVAYCADLGLLRGTPAGAAIANPLYREVLARELSYRTQANLPEPWWPWSRPDGTLDVPALVAAFIEWWRENAAVLAERANPDYLEAVPHLVFMAFLQRVVNGGGRITREYAAGRGRLDLLLEYQGEKHVFEIKRVPARHVSREQVREAGLKQIAGYLDTVGVTEGWLLIFDQRAGVSWEERLTAEDVEVGGKIVRVRGM